MPGTYLGGRMSTFSRLGVIYQRIRGASYGVWWGGGCGGDYVLWDRRVSADVWSRVNGVAYSAVGGGGYYLTAPDLGFSTSNSLTRYRDRLRAVEGRRLQLRCVPTAVAQPATVAEPPGVFWGEVAFHRSSGQLPQAPPNVAAAADPGGEMVVSWDGFADSELARIGSSVVGYVVEWRWFDNGTEHAQSGGVSPLVRSYTIQGLTPGRAYDVRVRATSTTHDGVWSPYISRSLPDPSPAEDEFPEFFKVELEEKASTRMGRAGYTSKVVLRLTDLRGVAVADTAVRVSISAGPSRGQEVICVVTSGSGRAPASGVPCTTTRTGHLTMYYKVPLAAANRVRYDYLRVHYDSDGDGVLEQNYNFTGFPYDAEPTRRVILPIAKAANYIALGDSYSSGENGDNPEPGDYQSGISAADAQCRRWDLAYPNIFNRKFLKTPELNIDVTFKTFACTGAITLNIYDPADPDGTPPPGRAHDTDRPSSHAQFGEPVPRPPVPYVDVGLLHERHLQWEPRQAVSLDAEETDLRALMRNVDMVTLTIGGNDAGFGDWLLFYTFVVECDPAVADAHLAQIEQSVVDVLARVKELAPDAAVFLLGYPHLTPEVDPCDNPQRIQQPPRTGPAYELDFSGLPDGCEALWNMYFDAVDSCETLSASGVFRGAFFYFGAALQAVLGSNRTRIDYREAKAMWSVGDDLNAMLGRAALRTRVHFVDVVGGVPLKDAPRGFVGHSSCNRADPWLNGFVVKSSRLPALDGSDGSTFHPTAAGQAAYARLLEEYIRIQTEAGAELNAAGLPVAPVSPVPSGPPGNAVRALVDSSQRSAKGREDSAGANGVDDSSSEPRSTVQAEDSAGLLVALPVSDVSGCGAPFVSPGEQVTLSADGFAAGAAVSFTVRVVSLGGTELTAPEIVAVTADSDGAIAAVWTVPTAPDAMVDAAPRALVVDASGLNTGGGVHSAAMGLPLVAYPDVTSCAKADTASTTLGASVRVAVLANDIAPTGGSLDAASVQVRAASGGSFAVDTTTGAVTFTPDPGFWGTVETSYVVYDS